MIRSHRDHGSWAIAAQERISRASARPLTWAARPPSGARRAECAGQARDAEQSDVGLAQLPGAARQRRGQPAPQGSERCEQEERDEAARQEGALPQQPAERADRLPVLRGRRHTGVRGQPDQHQGCEAEGEHREHDVDAAPAPDVGERAGSDPCTQNADHDSRGHHPDVPPAYGGRGDRSRVGDRDLHHDREHPGRRQPRERLPPGRRPCREHQADRGDRQVHGDEAAPVDHVAQRHQQQQACQIAELTGGHEPSGEFRRHAEVVPHRPQNRLRDVDARHGDTAHHRQQHSMPCVHRSPIRSVAYCNHFDGTA